jgi:hypothetical protein
MSLNIESLSNNAKTVLLARLAHALTISARDTYEAGTERVLEPEILRAYNELLHRVAGAVTNHLEGVEGYSLESILEMIRNFGEKHNRVNGMKWTIEWALKKPLG